jgi:hypothetical protein
MGEKISVSLSAFEVKLSPVALACFRVLFGNAKDRVTQDGPQKIYETPLAVFLERSGAGDIEAAAQSIREIIQCRAEIKKGDILYFVPFLASISIENGIVRYSLPMEFESVITSVPAPCPA